MIAMVVQGYMLAVCLPVHVHVTSKIFSVDMEGKPSTESHLFFKTWR